MGRSPLVAGAAVRLVDGTDLRLGQHPLKFFLPAGLARILEELRT